MAMSLPSGLLLRFLLPTFRCSCFVSKYVMLDAMKCLGGFWSVFLLFAFSDCQNILVSAVEENDKNEIFEYKLSLHDSKSFAEQWLLNDLRSTVTEYQTYNGWYNNPWHPSQGSAESSLIRLLPSAYQGGVYEPVNHTKANPFIVSDSIMKEISLCDGHNESSSRTGKNVFMVFFGQFVVEEVLNARQLSCPRNYFNIHIPSNHYYKKTGLKEMPFIRTKYDTSTGKSPNNPRKQLNSATAWIDGSAIYGTTNAVSQALRTFKDGLLVSSDEDNLYPSFNYGYLSYLSPSRNIDDSKIKKDHYKIGNPLAHENPFVLTINIIFYRWHNHLARIMCNKKEKWTDEQCFNEARKWVTATLQNVIVNEWLPSFLGEKLPEYIRYDPSIDPSISNAFQSAAMRFGHTLIPIGVYKRLKPNKCDTSVIRLCDSFYNAQEIIHNNSIESLIIGMAHQAAEREDISIVDDLRRYMHGPPEFTRRDLMALNIQRGRDHGLPGYAVARKMLLPNENIGSLDFYKMAAISKSSYKNVIENTLTQLYSSMDDVDLFVGGLLEADDELGPVFKEIIKEQFQRIRDGDRFWFENKENGIFTEDQIEQIRKTTMYDIILSVTQNIHSKDLQPDVFHVPTEDDLMNLTCADHFLPYECKIYGKEGNCFALPIVKSSVLKCSASVSVPLCSTSEPQTYDYFTGSGASYVLSFLFLFLFFIGSVIALFLLVHMRKKESLRLRQSVRQQRKVYSDENSCLATEWIGKSEGTRDVIIHFMQERKQMSITLLNKQVLRVIDLKHVQSVEFQVSAGSNLDYVLVRIAREYDLVLKFENPDEKEVFIEKLEACLGKIGIGRQRYEVNVSHMLKNAVTKAHRQAQLEKFFRVVFAQAFSIEHDDSEILGIDYNQAKEIVNIELTAYEFAEALSLRPEALFVKQMFALIDADGNGYISFREFLNVIVIFAKGSPEDKTKLMFDMYDIDHSGKLSRQEFSDMIRSLLELANQSLSSSQIEELIASMFSSAGLQKKQEITFDDFTHLLADHREELGYVQLSFNIGDGYKAAPASRKSIAVRAEETILRAYSVVGEENLTKTSKPASHLRVETKPVFYEKDPTKQQVNRIIRFIENNTSHIFWSILYTLVILGIFIQKAYYYSVEAEHTGLRRVAGYGVTVTRGAASSMIFAFATILLTMCRNTITFLRETFFHKYIPFDAAISFHKFIAFWALIFTTMHAIGHGINFYHVATQTVSDLQCLFPNFHLNPQKPPKFPYWLFQTITGITGVFLVIVMILMYVFAIQFARRHVFNAFWKTHNLYPVLYILMILHGIGHLIQPPIFYYYFLGPCVLFAVDRLISVSRKKVEISVLKAELLPSGVTHLEFKRPDNFEYKSGQWVRIACVPLNTNEYHPFTLSSAPHEENLSLHIRAVGPWTTNLRKVYDPNNLQQHAYPKIYLDGPYGEGHQDWFRYDVSVLVGGGIGITPFASILKDVVFKSSLKHKIFCKKIYFIWVTRSQKQFEWMTDILQEVEESDKNGLVDVHIFITQFYQKFDLRTTMLYICERHFQRVCGRSLFTGLRAKTHFGRPDFEVFLNSLRLEHSDVSKIGVFSCGPPPMTRSVELSCEELNKHEGAIFVHHYENF